MQNYANAGSFIGLVTKRALSKPIRAHGPFSAAALILCGASVLATGLLGLASIFTSGGLGIGIVIGVLLCLLYVGIGLIRPGATWFIHNLRRREEKKHPHRGPGSPH